MIVDVFLVKKYNASSGIIPCFVYQIDVLNIVTIVITMVITRNKKVLTYEITVVIHVVGAFTMSATIGSNAEPDTTTNEVTCTPKKPPNPPGP